MSATSDALSDGSWYFHIRSIDKAGNACASAQHLGPFVIGAPASPDLTANKNAVALGTISGLTTDTSVYLFNAGTGSFDWTVSESVSWLTVTPISGSISTGQDTLTISVDPAGLPAGPHEGTFTVSRDGHPEDAEIVAVSFAYETQCLLSVSGHVLMANGMPIGDVGLSYEAPDQVQDGINYGFRLWRDVEWWQEFRPAASTMSRVDIWLQRMGNPGDVLVSIRDTLDVSLWTGTLAEASIPDGGNWVSVPLTGTIGVVVGELYRICVHAAQDFPGYDNYCAWMGQTDSSYVAGASNTWEVSTSVSGRRLAAAHSPTQVGSTSSRR